MGRLRLIEKKEPPQATELSQLKKELRRVSEKLQSGESELAEALEQQNTTSEILRLIAARQSIVNRSRRCDRASVPLCKGRNLAQSFRWNTR